MGENSTVPWCPQRKAVPTSKEPMAEVVDYLQTIGIKQKGGIEAALISTAQRATLLASSRNN